MPLLAVADVHADNDAEVTSQYFGDFPVVLSVSRLIQPVDEAPAAVTVIDRETIRASGARQVAEIFRLVPGFLVTYRNGHSPTVTYHGLADTYARRLQVMIDGVSVYSPTFGGVDWTMLPISVEDIERIEIVRGPNGASYGANAFVGMINIITREPTAASQWEVEGNAGENGIRDWSVRHFGGVDDWRYRLAVGDRGDEGFLGRNDTSRVRYANFRGHFQLDSVNELMGTLAHTDGDAWEQYEYTRPRQVEDSDLRLRWTRAQGDDEFWLQYHHNERRMRERYVEVYIADLRPLGGTEVPTAVPVVFDNDMRRDEVEFQRTFGAVRDWRFVLGGQWRSDAARSQGLFGRQDWITNRMARLFGSAEWQPLRQLTLHVGATYENTSLTGGAWSPRLSATWALAEGHTLRAGVSKARRTPTLYEEYANQSYAVPENLHNALSALAPMLPAPWNTTVLLPVMAQTYRASGGLEDEKIFSREIAYLGKLPALGLSGEVRWFNDQIRDLIYMYRITVPTALNPASVAGDIRNMDRADMHGIEGSVRWVPWQGGSVMASAARTIIESSNIDVDCSSSAPVHSVSLLFSQRLFDGLSFSAAYYRLGPMTWLSGGEPLPASERLDLRLGKTYRWGRQRLGVDWVIQNATNEDSPEFDDLRHNRRISWLRFQYEF